MNKIETYDKNNPEHNDKTKYEVVEWEDDFTGRKPNEVFFTNSEEDAKRRDFTVNALFFDPITGEHIDYVGGKKDLEEKILRAIGEPAERFNEDYLRMIRAVRFSAQKGFKIEEKTYEAIKQAAGNINKISKERIKDEMEKILSSSNPGDALEVLADTGLLQELFPEVAELVGVDQNPKHHPEGNSFIHVKNALNSSENDLVLRWSLLLHDIGKKETTRINPKTNALFSPGHEAVSTKKAEAILNKYKFDSKMKKDILWLIENHGKFMSWDNMGDYKKKIIASHPLFPMLIKHYEADRKSSMNDEITASVIEKMKNYNKYLDDFKTDSDKFQQMNKFNIITGDDLKQAPFNFKPGPIMKEILDDVKEKYITGVLKDKEAILEYLKKKYAKRIKANSPNFFI